VVRTAAAGWLTGAAVRAGEVAAWVVAALWVYLFAGRGRYWSTAVRLPGAQPPPAPAHWPTVTVVIPARDEEATLALTLPSVLAQDYPGRASVVLVDDGSRDGTVETAQAAAGGLPLDVIRGAARPPGWMGKPWALHQGVEHIAAAPGSAGRQAGPGGQAGQAEPPEWLLLTDADIRHPPDSLRLLVAVALADGRDEVSLMARLRVETSWERLLIPAFVYFFAQLYPFRRVGRPGRTAAAAGGCVLVRRGALEAAGGVASIREAVIDDVALARRLKQSGASIWLGLAGDVRSERPYPRLADLWHMVARSAFTQLRCSVWLLFATLVGLLAIYLGPLAALVAGLVRGDGWLAGAGAFAASVMFATYLPMIRYYGLGWPWALTLPAAALMYGAMTADSARRHWQGRGVEWKGRRISDATAMGDSGAGRRRSRRNRR
jgi:hopene-associated glycosyltransferase HpnB